AVPHTSVCSRSLGISDAFEPLATESIVRVLDSPYHFTLSIQTLNLNGPVGVVVAVTLLGTVFVIAIRFQDTVSVRVVRKPTCAKRHIGVSAVRAALYLHYWLPVCVANSLSSPGPEGTEIVLNLLLKLALWITQLRNNVLHSYQAVCRIVEVALARVVPLMQLDLLRAIASVIVQVTAPCDNSPV